MHWKSYAGGKLFSCPHPHPGLTIFPHSNGIPALKCLVDNPLGSNERASLIMDVFSVHSEAELVVRLRGNDAQPFVDAIDEVFHFFISDELTH